MRRRAFAALLAAEALPGLARAADGDARLDGDPAFDAVLRALERR